MKTFVSEMKLSCLSVSGKHKVSPQRSFFFYYLDVGSLTGLPTLPASHLLKLTQSSAEIMAEIVTGRAASTPASLHAIRMKIHFAFCLNCSFLALNT